jgi:pimeloyl-ACP methyl ester carboxylesterase
MAVRARADALRRALSAGERELRCSGARQPAAYDALISVLQMFSPATLNDDAAVSAWLDVYEMSAERRAAARGQDAIDVTSDRRAAFRAVPVPCRVIGFSDDLMCPPHLCAEVAEAIPDCDYVEIGSCGHVGYLERPGEVNTAIIEFLDKNLAVMPDALTRQISIGSEAVTTCPRYPLTESGWPTSARAMASLCS